jgi:hypothetical protein
LLEPPPHDVRKTAQAIASNRFEKDRIANTMNLWSENAYPQGCLRKMPKWEPKDAVRALHDHEKYSAHFMSSLSNVQYGGAAARVRLLRHAASFKRHDAAHDFESAEENRLSPRERSSATRRCAAGDR